MPKTHISQSQSGQFFANAADTTWIIDQGVVIDSNADHCFNSTWQNTRVVLKGTLDHNGMFGSAIALLGSGGGLTVALGGTILSETTGMYMAGNALDVINHGLVMGRRGVVVDGQAVSVTNTGEIVGDQFAGVRLAGMDGDLFNARGAMIRGQVGIDTDGASGDGTQVKNFGTIKGDDWALSCGNADDYIINRGKIVGSVLLGGGQNVFDTRGGVVLGDIAGGDGEDIYFVDDASIAIFEGAGNGFDILKTSVSLALESNNEIEVVTAIGNRGVTLSGNEIGNRLNGNKAGNTLKGGGGEDWLHGGRGDDRLNGGTETDRFVLRKGGDDDIVTGFVSGEDIVYVENFYLDNGFDDLLDRMKEDHGNLVISFGTDSMTLKGTGLSDVIESDFTFADV